MNTDGPVTELELTGLKSFTTYTFSVTCVNGAGEGNTSDSVEAKTNSARKKLVLSPLPVLYNNMQYHHVSVVYVTAPDPEVVRTAIAAVPLTEQTNGQRYIVRFNKPDDTNGPIRFIPHPLYVHSKKDYVK